MRARAGPLATVLEHARVYDRPRGRDERSNRLRFRCRGQDSNLYGSCLPRDFKSLASTDFATPAALTYPLASHAARRMHRVDRRLTSVRGAEFTPNLTRYLLLAGRTAAPALSQQDDHRTAPSGARESGTERARPPSRGHDRIQLGAAAVEQSPARFVGLVQQLTEALQAPAREQLRAEPRARRLAHDMERAGAERLGQRPLEARQPGRRPAREPLQLRQLELEPGHRRLAFGAPLVERPGGELTPDPRVHEQQARGDRDVTRRQ